MSENFEFLQSQIRINEERATELREDSVGDLIPAITFTALAGGLLLETYAGDDLSDWKRAGGFLVSVAIESASVYFGIRAARKLIDARTHNNAAETYRAATLVPEMLAETRFAHARRKQEERREKIAKVRAGR